MAEKESSPCDNSVVISELIDPDRRARESPEISLRELFRSRAEMDEIQSKSLQDPDRRARSRAAMFKRQSISLQGSFRRAHIRAAMAERRSESLQDMRIVLLGKTGVGKSATGNTILGREAFTADLSQDSITKDCQRETAELNGRHIAVIDTPGLFNTELSNEDIQREITNCISMILPGPHVFIIVLNLGQRFTQEEANSVKIIQEMFGKNSLMYTMILFTRGDYLKNKNIGECLGKPGSPLMKLIEECGNRFHVFNNNETSDRTQVSDLLEKIDAMVKANGDSYYSCEMFRDMQREQHRKRIMGLEEDFTMMNEQGPVPLPRHRSEMVERQSISLQGPVPLPRHRSVMDEGGSRRTRGSYYYDPNVWRSELSWGHVTDAMSLTDICKSHLAEGGSRRTRGPVPLPRHRSVMDEIGSEITPGLRKCNSMDRLNPNMSEDELH